MLQMLSSYLNAITDSKNLLFLLLLSFAVPQANAQVNITIGGNVYGGGEAGKVTEDGNVTIKSGTFTGNIYGGGNLGDLEGQTTVTLQGGDIQGHVFGGARMANVGEFTYVNVDGENQLHDLTVNHVYGGNDISGQVGDNLTGSEGETTGLPFTPDVNNGTVYVDNTFQSFIQTTPERSLTTGSGTDEVTTQLHTFIGQMFNGGNGDYTYGTEANSDGEYEVKSSDGTTVIATSATAFAAPEIGKSYMQVNGGTYGYVYAGGNAATVTEDAIISINNTSTISTSTDVLDLTQKTSLETMMTDPSNIDLDNPVDLRLLAMGLNLSTFHIGHHFNRVFGGNNKADMAIMPQWNLTKGNIHDLYSGGNEGRMINEQGILLEIKDGSEISAVNVYGGCRKADVHPMAGNQTAATERIQIEGYYFPAGYSARVLVRGGDIRNVYGGNDISGYVWGGNAVGIYHDISGDVYGGGNGSYAYTDNADLKDDLIWGDYYYDVNALLGQDASTKFTQAQSVEALNLFRPNAEQVSLRLWGPSEDERTIIGGAVYVGGNSASLKTTKTNPRAELKIGSNVIAEKVFLGNNGENMVDASSTGVLARYAGSVTTASQTTKDFSSLDLTDSDIFAGYMKGCAMHVYPRVVFDGDASTDPDTYDDYTSYIGSLYCGGNVGSMMTSDMTTINFNRDIIIYNKLVGGCNNANVPESTYNAAYYGGLLGVDSEQSSYTDTDGNIKDRLTLNLGGVNSSGETHGVKLVPQRWKMKELTTQPAVGDNVADKIYVDNTTGEIGVETDEEAVAVSGRTYYDFDLENGQKQLQYNVYSNSSGLPIVPYTTPTETGAQTDEDRDRRLIGGNIYGGCYNSGHVNGNVIININSTIHDRDKLFDKTTAPADAKLYDYDDYEITERRTGVLIGPQAWDVSVITLGVFGGGYGEDSEVWGSATVNLNRGYTFQIYGGGQMGIIGKYLGDSDNLTYNSNYYTRVNLNGTTAGDASTVDETMPEAVFLYGGAYEGLVLGNTQTNLGNGRVFNSFGGSCAADVYGHSELFMGRGSNDDSNQGFPWVIDYAYGGNDVAGKIKNSVYFTERISEVALPKVYQYDASSNPTPLVTQASAYVEYQQGRAEAIFGGCCGNFDYVNDDYYKAFATADKLPFIENAFVNFKPLVNTTNNSVAKVFGGSEGCEDGSYKDQMQNRSYVLVDVPQNWTTFTNTEVFGAGKNGGVGMYVAQTDARENSTGVVASAVIDLARGQVNAAYGGSLSQGMTRRTIVNVPSTSTVVMNNIFGGAYGEDPLVPCDVYQSIVNYNSGNARVNGAIYGGNNNADRTLYTQVNINVPVKQSNGYDGYVFGAGKGVDTWAQYTEVNLNEGSSVYEVYGGGNDGRVLNEESVLKWAAKEEDLDLTLGGLGDGYTDLYLDDDEGDNIVRTSQLYNDLSGKYETYAEKYNTNVIINQGAVVKNYAYGAGKGSNADVSGTTYVELNGGTVNKDIYAAGTEGSVEDLYKCGTTGDGSFTASTTVYVRGGSCRNVYGGGWKGAVGYHDTSTTETTNDILGETHVVIGRTKCGDENSLSFYDGKPVVQRNAYGAGEGGVVFGTSNLTLYNGYIGYYYDTTTSKYEEDLDDETADDGIGEGLLKEAGNIFGSGYADYSNTDFANITLYGGVVRNSVYGGGEIGTVGRGLSDGTVHFGGKTHVKMYNGHVMRDVFGGGRGYDNQNKVSAIGTSGYVFGSTDVGIYGGEVGTDVGVADGYGNVFGGGNVGFVYSATGTKGADGYYYDTENKLTEDCKVVIKPYCKVLTAYDPYAACSYVPTNVLDTYPYNSGNWTYLDKTGITIHNSVFAGGNVSSGSDQVYANTATVFGNATASVIDLFEEDLISVGDDGIGGLYGDGNLTLVDGYRELNITNYGTDYNHLDHDLTYEKYQQLNKRQRAYYELKYKSKTEHTYEYYMSKTTHVYGDITYKKGQKITADSYNELSSEEQANWTQGSTTYAENEKITETEYDLLDATERGNWELYGFATLYEGRMMNTIQRADFCGVFGSRIALRGAQDRVPSVVDYTEYTINRVGELSLNQVTNSNTGINATNGNYFGIYNVVNYLGALTSDVDFHTGVRTYDNSTTDAATNQPDVEGQTYYNWKQEHLNQRKRNNGTSANQVALSSGVALWILDESTETAGEKVYGPITGVVQLELINVSTGEGGGYVYAKNEHGAFQSKSETGQTTLTAANNNAISYKQYTYAAVTADDKMETSGNFINPVKRIVDDCYPTSSSFYGDGASAGHYWFVRGDFYVYDQYISAYTGSAQAYAEMSTIPLTITAESQGKLKLAAVNKNLYAYWDDATLLPKYQSSTETNAIVVGGITYHKNDPISYWTYSHLSDAEKELFWDGETYVCSNTAEYNNVTYTAGDVYTSKPADIYVCTQQYKYTDNNSVEQTVAEGTVITASEYNNLDDETIKDHYAIVFNPSNVVDHSKGFVLTFDWDNPDIWNDYYHQQTGTGTVRASLYNSIPNNYVTSPSYLCTEGGVYGQISYDEGDLIGKTVYDYEAGVTSHLTSDETAKQGAFAAAYVAKDDCQFTVNGTNYQYVKGACVSETLYDTFGSNQSNFEAGYLCDETYAKSETEYYLSGDVIPQSEYNTLYNAATTEEKTTIESCFSNAYICTTAGLWGGEVFTANNNYPAIKYSNLNASERANFTFNYDALDVLIDPDYQNLMSYYDSENGTEGNTLYSKQQSIDYTATYTGANLTADNKLTNSVTVKRGDTPVTTDLLTTGDVLSNTAYESLVNYQYNYTPIVVTGSSINDVYYIVNSEFQVGDNEYVPGNQITETVYNKLSSENKGKVTRVTKEALAAVETLPTGESFVRYYFCKNAYNNVTVGSLISYADYSNLTNEQKNFTIDGKIPSETSTLYVAREATIDELSSDRIITVVYYYDYVESDESGSSYENIREKHVVNIHIHFESGVPTIGELLPPRTVLPGDRVSLNKPTVTKGAYEILGGGWEIFTSESDAISHQNGSEYSNYVTPMYWYQNGAWVAYYAKSYLGKTYSNPVQISVANYHDIDDVMKDKEHHMYVDYDPEKLDRICKIYIDDRECESDATKSELDLLKDLFDLSLQNAVDGNGEHTEISSGTLDGHYTVNSYINGLANLDFILRSDVAPKAYTDWTPIGGGTTESPCFSGNFHGDGYTISGLNNSLFGSLCGNVYNTGVTGSFTSAGIADTGEGYVENCWTYSSATTMTTGIQGVFGNPTESTGKPQIVNCYYPVTNEYSVTSNDNGGVAMARPVASFYNGEVAYDLNGFYLYKRYNDNATGLTKPSENDYKYYDADDLDNDGNMTLKSSSYIAAGITPETFVTQYYIEDYRYGNEDFIYADGVIPEGENEHYDSDEDTYHPIWPDDYIFFGQTLTYGHVDGRDHQDYPSYIKKVDDRLQTTGSNRVYRAPAYFQSSKMSVAHFNPDAVFAQTKKGDATVIAYKNMTAIDYTGHNDVSEGYQQGRISSDPYNNFSDGAFYPPLLDDDGLTSFTNVDLTKNLLVYIPQSTDTDTDAATKTYTVVTDYLEDPTYAETNTTATPSEYRAVAASTATLHGHRVVKDADAYTYTAPVDHYLVDKNDFNAPMAYTFASGKRMWYQRVPSTYVDLTKGWEGISIPFSPELVTTQTKGEITHFYSGSTAGHEYWLRGYTSGGAADSKDESIYVANFTYPAAGSNEKSYTNTFLWDYYYSQNPESGKTAGQDENTDEYQHDDDNRTYYKDTRTYSDYPYATAATPYIIGFPGVTYYEFDLSGNFVPQNTYQDIAQLQKQTITFASETGITIGVSDTELESGKVTADNFVFTPNYLSKDVAAGAYMLTTSNKDKTAYTPVGIGTTLTSGNTYYTSNTGEGEFTADGTEVATGSNYYVYSPTTNSTFKRTSAATAGVPFRPYFTATASSGAPKRGLPEEIAISDITDIGEIAPSSGDLTEGLNIFATQGKIIVESHRKTEARVRILTPTGITVATFILPPGERIETSVRTSGIYLVNTRKLHVSGR